MFGRPRILLSPVDDDPIQDATPAPVPSQASQEAMQAPVEAEKQDDLPGETLVVGNNFRFSAKNYLLTYAQVSDLSRDGFIYTYLIW